MENCFRSSLFIPYTINFKLSIRLQNETAYNNVWTEVRKIIADSDTLPVSKIETMSGKDEGTFSWTTVNQLFGNKV